MGFGFGGLVCAKLIDVFVPKSAEVVLRAEVRPYEVKDHLPRDTPDITVYKVKRAAFDEAQRTGATEGPAYEAGRALISGRPSEKLASRERAPRS